MRKIAVALCSLVLAGACQDLAPVTAPIGPSAKPGYIVYPPPDNDPCYGASGCTTYSYDGNALADQFTVPYCFGWTNAGAPALSASNDRDADGLRDDCEYQIARSFRPMLARDNSDAAPGRESYWAVRPKPGATGTVQVFYALGYYYDAGGYGLGLKSHQGDSEFIILEITNNMWSANPALWSLDAETLSAHWGEDAGIGQDHTGTYGYSATEYPGAYRGRPRVWVSKNKHANYVSKSACYGSATVDYCDQPWDATAYEDVDVFDTANLGSNSHRLLNCVPSRHPGTNGAAYGVECFWDSVAPARFAGWSGQPTGAATPYGVMLTAYGF